MGGVKYLLDSNICIHFMKDDKKVIAKIHEIGFQNCYLSEMTVLELLYGVANSQSTRKNENRLKLKQFEESFDDRILMIRPVFEIFAEQKTRLRKLGIPISDFGLFIGCSALERNFVYSKYQRNE